MSGKNTSGVSSRNLAIIVILVILIVLVGIVLVSSFKKTGNNSALPPVPIEASSTSPIQNIVQIDPSKLPPGFPSDFPAQNQTQVVANYSGNLNNRVFSSRQLVVNQSMQTAFAYYQNYFKQAGWTLIPGKISTTTMIGYASKNGGALSATYEISQATQPNESLVNIYIFSNGN